MVVEKTLLLRHEVLDIVECLVQLALASEHGVVEAHYGDALGVRVALAAAHGVEDVFGDFGDLGAALLELLDCQNMYIWMILPRFLGTYLAERHLEIVVAKVVLEGLLEHH